MLTTTTSSSNKFKAVMMGVAVLGGTAINAIQNAPVHADTKVAHADNINNNKQQNTQDYTVVKGDSLWKIAQNKNVTVQNLVDWNHLGTNTTIKPGQVLHLQAQQSNDQNGVYTVVKNDTLFKIAKNYNISLQQLYQWNSQHDNNHTLIHPGDKINVTQDAANRNNNQIQRAGQQSTAVAQPQQQVQTQAASVPAGSGSVYDQFIAAGGTPAMWQYIVMPESGGNPNAVNGRYRGLGQGDVSYGWPTGDVATQTRGMINYANSRYGSIAGAVSFRQTHNFW